MVYSGGPIGSLTYADDGGVSDVTISNIEATAIGSSASGTNSMSIPNAQATAIGSAVAGTFSNN